VLSLEIFIGKLLAIDRLPTSTIAASEITTLQHELGNDAVELAALVSKAFFTGAESPEVLSGLWDYIIVEIEVDPASLGGGNRYTGLLCVRPGLVKGQVGPLDIEERGHTHGCC